MMMTLRLIVPPDRTGRVIARLADDERLTDLVVLPGAAVRPRGDLVQCEVTREAVSDVLGWLRDQDLYEDGSVVLSEVVSAPSANARATEAAAPGAPDDAIVWDSVLDSAYGEVRGSWSLYAFLTLATAIAAVAVVTDSSILVVGAMVVGPEFGLVAALAVGLAGRRLGLVRGAALLLLKGFGLAIAATVVLVLLARLVGWVDLSDVTGPRPLTGFIWRPDKWSAVVAVLAGCAGVLSQTAGRSSAPVGVFISVTTVPAAGDIALSLALGAPGHLLGAAAQLGINLLGITVAGVATLLVQRALWKTRRRSRAA
ncbi:putative hydrophobic protein (TIGR00271 family) [Microlunatus capsulatus]|uniref:Hydrophobic protein (TIGR00271 family) n=2 Tax=Microlunatus capsulatus TaxID=99117 RepID=A0ABS4Z2P5_9ACTN|nr:putative hydrophobic protein (TIGR00271 family) [Microlunatus capsulatus]